MKCTYCGGTEFYEGPSGGMSTNVLCANPKCRHWFNCTMGELDDLDRVEPSDEEKAAARKEEVANPKMNIAGQMVPIRDIRYEGAVLFSAGRPASDCLKDAPYGNYGAAASNLVRLTGWLDAREVLKESRK